MLQNSFGGFYRDLIGKSKSTTLRFLFVLEACSGSIDR